MKNGYQLAIGLNKAENITLQHLFDLFECDYINPIPQSLSRLQNVMKYHMSKLIKDDNTAYMFFILSQNNPSLIQQCLMYATSKDCLNQSITPIILMLNDYPNLKQLQQELIDEY